MGRGFSRVNVQITFTSRDFHGTMLATTIPALGNLHDQ
jgi:hypothetical protein